MGSGKHFSSLAMQVIFKSAGPRYMGELTLLGCASFSKAGQSLNITFLAAEHCKPACQTCVPWAHHCPSWPGAQVAAAPAAGELQG